MPAVENEVPTERLGRDRLRVASWNLHEGIPVSGGILVPGGADHRSREVAAEIGGLLADRRVDVAAFQEVGFDAEGTSEVLEHIRNTTRLRHIVTYPLHESSFFPDRLSGVAVASRFPLRDPRRHMLPNPELRTRFDGKEIRSHDKGLVSATLSPDGVDGVDGVDVEVTSLHSFPFYLFGREPGETEFKEIWDELSDELRRHLHHHPLVVCGDFNTPERGLLLSEDRLPLASSIAGRVTYKDRSVDDILYGPGIGLAGTEIVENFSDHRLCLADFLLRSRG
ncbi:endonuclease/exonuclease/phosphatase family protein [Streptomyces sp. NPDC048275]|uniref:endonuclease/exonuclease/phosphatase family protein n=1 Tax=Streptomyces sp. NPDC048275 TaxID=3155629 RepID=UPI0033D7CD02